MTGQQRIPAAEVKARVPIERVVGAVVALRRAGGELVGLCPFHQEKTGSFCVNPAKQLYLCRGCGAAGDVITFYREYHGVDWGEAIMALAQLAGLPVPEAARLLSPPQQRLAPPRGRAGAPVASGAAKIAPSGPATTAGIEDAAAGRALHTRIMAIWRSCLPANGTAVEAYLRGRGIDLDAIGGVPVSLRFHPELPHHHPDTGLRSFWPAMVAGVQGKDGAIVALHRTYLAPANDNGFVGKAPADRVPKAKLMLGPCMTAAVRLAPAGDETCISEGIENGLVVMADLARAGTPLPVWAALSLGNICGGAAPGRTSRPHPFKPKLRIQTEHFDPARPGIILPHRVARVTILGDSDSDPYVTRALVNRGVRRFQAQGRAVRVVWPPAGQDFTDLKTSAANDR